MCVTLSCMQAVADEAARAVAASHEEAMLVSFRCLLLTYQLDNLKYLICSQGPGWIECSYKPAPETLVHDSCHTA